MKPNIVTKFAIASEEGVEIIKHLTRTIAKEKFEALIPSEMLDNYINEELNDKKLIDDLNESLTTQWLVVYKNDQPAGYARITSKGERPVVEEKSIISIADFGVLQEYNEPEVLQSLLDKCYYICKIYQAVWLHEYKENPLLFFFEANKFKRMNQESDSYGLLPLPSVFMIREKEEIIPK